MLTLASHCPLDCPDACSLLVTVQDGKIARVEGSHRNPLTAGIICSKVRGIAAHVYGEDRIAAPAVRIGPKAGPHERGPWNSSEQAKLFRTVSWDEALDTVARRLKDVQNRLGGEAILPFYYGGSNGFLTQDALDARLFRRLGASTLLRTLCAAPTGAAAAGLYGKMPGVPLTAYVHARLIVIWGANPTASGIHLGPIIAAARAAGAKLVVIDPRRTRLAKQADLHLAIRPGTDLPVALALHRWLFESGRADQAFLSAHTHGGDRLAEKAQKWTFAAAAAEAGIDAADLQNFAALYADSTPAVIRIGWGLERNRNAGSAAAAIMALPAVAGKFGLRGGGYTMSNSPVFRHLDPNVVSAEPPAGTRDINMSLLGQALTDLTDPPIGALFVYNCNPVATVPHQEKVRTGLRRDDLFTVVFDAVWTDSTRYADVVLPATTFLEHQELHRGYGAMILEHAQPVIAPVGQARSNNAVFGDLVTRLHLNKPDDPVTDEALITALLDSTPDGIRLKQELHDNSSATPPFGPDPIQFVDVFPGTPDRKIDLFPEALDQQAPLGLYGYAPDPGTAEAPLALISPAQADTISSTFGQLDRSLAHVELAPADATARGIGDGDTVRIFNGQGEIVCLSRINPDLRPGVASLAKGLWAHHTKNGSTANAVIPDTVTDLGGGACYNDARVQIVKTAKAI